MPVSSGDERWGVLVERLRQYALLIRLDKPIGTLLLLWPTLWGLWVAAEGRPDPWVLFVFLCGVFLMRSAGCAVNDYADREIDPFVERTRNRPLAAGAVSPQEALTVFLVLSICAWSLVWTLNGLTVALSTAGIAMAAVYPFTKRYIYHPQLLLGVAFSWGIPMAFAAQTNTVPAVAWGLVAANAAWVVAYDTMYAMVDRGDDVRIGVKSTAILFGRYDRAVIALLHVLTLAILLALGRHLGLNAYYFGGLLAATGFSVYQQFLIRHRVENACFRAFLNNAWFGAAVFLGLALAYLP